MTLSQLFDAAVALYGERWQRSLARALGLSERTVRWWLQDESGKRLPRDLATRLDGVFEARIHELQEAMGRLRREVRKAKKRDAA